MSGASRFAAVLVTTCASAAAFAGDQFVGVRADGALVAFDATNPSTFTSVHAITGLAVGEIVVGTCVRPTDGALFAVGSTSRVYEIQADTGFASPVGGFLFSPPLDGTDFGLTFDPSATTLRLTSDTGQSLALDPSTGGVSAVGQRLVYAAGDVNAGASAGIVGLAYVTSQQNGSKLYGIDLARGLLAWIDVQTTGTVHTVGPLGVSGIVTGGFTGFDVSASTGVAYAELAPQNGSVSYLYSVNLATGAATQVGSAMPALLHGASVVLASPLAPAGTQLVALVSPTDLYTVTTDKPQLVQRTVHVRGLPSGDAFVGVAVRPKNGVLYGLTRTAIYNVDESTGTAELVGAGFSTPLPTGPASCDFDPASDVLRVASTTGANQRIDADVGDLVDSDVVAAGVQGDAVFAFAPGDPNQSATPTVGAIAFSGRTKPTSPSTAFVLEDNAALVARLGAAADAPDESRDGLLFTIGALSIDNVSTLPPGRGLVATGDTTAYAAVQDTGTSSRLYHVDLTTGKASLVGAVGAPGVVSALTVSPTTNPPRLVVSKFSAALNFKKHGRDALSIAGSVPNPVGDLLGTVVTVNVGGASVTYTLDAKGRGKSGVQTMRIAGLAAHGLALKLAWKKIDLVSFFSEERMDGLVFAQRDPRQVLVSVAMDGKTYKTLVDLAYSAKPGKTGKAVTN